MILDLATKTKSNIRSSSQQKIKVILDLKTLNIFCKYVMSTSAYVRVNHISNLGKLIRNLDPDTYMTDVEKTKRIKFLLRALEARIDYRLTDINMVWVHIMDNIDIDVDFISEGFEELDKDSITWVNNIVSEMIQYHFVYNSTDPMLDICTRIRNSDYRDRGALIQEYEKLIDDLKNQFRKAKIDDDFTNMTFSLRPGVFEQAVTDTYNIVTSPSRRLITGMQGLNEMLGGGFEAERVYMFVGITGAGKSITLLNLIYQIKKYNKNYKTKDPTKTPCIVLLTMENSVVETITRLFDMVVEDSIGMANYSLDEVLRKLREEGELKITDESPIDIVIKYKADHSVDTSWLYSMSDDLEDDGYEIICLVQDHVGRIRSTYNYSETRFELGQVVNEFKIFAQTKRVPVITDTHFNREAMKMIEDMTARSIQTDVTKKLGKGYTAESVQMQNNLDVSISINKDYDAEGNMYMGMYLSKMRDVTNRTYIAQPFVYGSSIRLVEDYGTVPMFKESLHQNMDINSRINGVRTSSSSVLANMGGDSNTNTFSNTGVYAFTPSTNFDEFNEFEQEIPKLQQPEIVCPFIFYDKVKKPENVILTSLKDKLANRQVVG